MICAPCNRRLVADVCDTPAPWVPLIDGARWCERFPLRAVQPSLFNQPDPKDLLP